MLILVICAEILGPGFPKRPFLYTVSAGFFGKPITSTVSFSGPTVVAKDHATATVALVELDAVGNVFALLVKFTTKVTTEYIRGQYDTWPDLTSTVTVWTDVARNGYPVHQDIRWRQSSRPCGGHCNSDLAGVKTPELRHLAGVELGVTMLVISQGSGASSLHLRALRFFRPFQVRLLREACLGSPRECQLWARQKRRSGSPSVTRREAASQKRETGQARGRHPYLVTRAAVSGV